MLADYANWFAVAATATAACVTASNLGSRVTGWGFVIFLTGSIAWATYAAATDQAGLLWQNIFLCFVNILGIWRWLGRRARFDDGAKAAMRKSDASPDETLFPTTMLGACAVKTRGGETIGQIVEAMASCGTGRIAYAVVSEGGVAGVGETLRLLPWKDAVAADGYVTVPFDADALRNLKPVSPTDWPGRAAA